MADGIKKIFQTQLTDTATTDLEGVGTIRFEGSKIYKWVVLTNATATVTCTAGDVLGYRLAQVANCVVVSDNTDSQTKPIGAGVVVTTETVAGVAGTSYYLWVQIKGAATALKDLAGTPADGDALFLSTTDLTLTLATAADDPVVAYADDDSAQLITCDFPF